MTSNVVNITSFTGFRTPSASVPSATASVLAFPSAEDRANDLLAAWLAERAEQADLQVARTAAEKARRAAKVRLNAARDGNAHPAFVARLFDAYRAAFAATKAIPAAPAKVLLNALDSALSAMPTEDGKRLVRALTPVQASRIGRTAVALRRRARVAA